MTTTDHTPVPGTQLPVIPDECLVAARAADAKSGEETVILAMGDLLGVTDAFVVTNGRNTRQVRTIVDEVERQVKLSPAGGHRSGSRDSTTPTGCSWTTATSWSTCSWTRPGRSTTSSTCGTTHPGWPGPLAA